MGLVEETVTRYLTRPLSGPTEYTFNCRHLSYAWQRGNRPPWTKPALLRCVPIAQVILPDDEALDGEELVMKLEQTFKSEMTYPGQLESTVDCVWNVTFGVSLVAVQV